MATQQLFPKSNGGTGGGVSNWGDIGGIVTDQTDLVTYIDDQLDSVVNPPNWGVIGGTLSDQTDLQSVLNSKQDALARGTTQLVTGSLVNLAEEIGVVALGKHSVISKILADVECRVRLYPTATLRAADLARLLGVAVVEGDNEPLLEVVPVVGALSVLLFDTPIVYNGDVSPTSNIYYAIQNRSGSTDTVQVTFTVLVLEN